MFYKFIFSSVLIIFQNLENSAKFLEFFKSDIFVVKLINISSLFLHACLLRQSVHDPFNGLFFSSSLYNNFRLWKLHFDKKFLQVAYLHQSLRNNHPQFLRASSLSYLTSRYLQDSQCRCFHKVIDQIVTHVARNFSELVGLFPTSIQRLITT